MLFYTSMMPWLELWSNAWACSECHPNYWVGSIIPISLQQMDYAPKKQAGEVRLKLVSTRLNRMVMRTWWYFWLVLCSGEGACSCFHCFDLLTKQGDRCKASLSGHFWSKFRVIEKKCTAKLWNQQDGKNGKVICIKLNCLNLSIVSW